MPNFTLNYQLNQWEPSDDFLRTDFNEDNAKIDTALHSAEDKAARALAALERQGHDLHNLLLQNYYDGKYTGYKRSILFDGFLDESLTASRDAALIRSQNRLQLTKTGQSDLSLGYDGGNHTFNNNFTPQTLSPTAGGKFTGWVCKMNAKGENQACLISYTVTLNGTIVAEKSNHALTLGTAATEHSFTLATPVAVTAGDSLVVAIKSNTSAVYLFYPASGGGGIGGTFRFTGLSAPSAGFKTKAAALPNRKTILAWVRHAGGTVSMNVLDGSASTAMTKTAAVSTKNIQQESCSESAFLLDNAPQGESLSFQITTALGSAETKSQIFDYGITVL